MSEIGFKLKGLDVWKTVWVGEKKPKKNQKKKKDSQCS